MERNMLKTVLQYRISFKQTQTVFNSDCIYLFKVNNGNTRTMGEICSKATIKAPKLRHRLSKTLINK